MELNKSAYTNIRYQGLTLDQIYAFDGIRDWLNSKELIATLEGDAGTGKTYLLKRILKYLIPSRDSAVVTAPTHKAVRVAEKMTATKGMTLQSLHGLRPNFNLEEFSLDDIKFQAIASDKFRNYRLVICDEGSQIGSMLHRLNVRRAEQFNTKILYVGDSKQIPPVNERMSQVFTNVKDKFILREVVRQGNESPLLDIFEYLKRDIENGGDTFLEHIKTNRTSITKDKGGYILLGKDVFQKTLIDYFSSEQMSKDVNYARYLAWTNRNINAWNAHIRNNLVKSKELVDFDDLFIGYKTIVESVTDETSAISLVNSEDYLVSNIEKRKVAKYDFDIYKVELVDVISSKITKVLIVDHKNKEGWANFLNELKIRHYNAMFAPSNVRAIRWKEYFKFKDTYLSLIDFQIPYLTQNKYITRDIDYGYALTVHKSQGSTFNNVFVNLIDMCYKQGTKGSPITLRTSPLDEVIMRNKLIYTACTRASKNLFILL